MKGKIISIISRQDGAISLDVRVEVPDIEEPERLNMDVISFKKALDEWKDSSKYKEFLKNRYDFIKSLRMGEVNIEYEDK